MKYVLASLVAVGLIGGTAMVSVTAQEIGNDSITTTMGTTANEGEKRHDGAEKAQKDEAIPPIKVSY